MPLLTRKMPSWEGVAAGQTATVRLPIGNTYHKLLVPYSGVTLAQMDEIRIIANGKTIQRIIGGDVLDSMNQFDGRNAAAGILTIDFERFGLRTRAGSEFTVIGTGASGDAMPITTLAVEIDINAAAAAPVLTAAKAVQSAPQQSGVLKQVRAFGYDPAGAGDYEISDLPRLGLINRVFFKSAVVINSVKLARDGYTVFERTTAENAAVQNDGVRVTQANYWVMDFSEEGNGQDALAVAGVQDLRFTLDMAGAGHVDVIVEYLAPLNN
jgi:hypothetical protein